MKKFTKTLVATALLGGTGVAVADSMADSISGNVAFTSNYLFRGISQTGQDYFFEPALQGGMDYAHSSGLYAGFWGSNVELGDGKGNTADLELDLYGGYAGEYSGVGYDLGVLYFEYPSTQDLDFLEIYGALSHDFGPAAASAKVSYSPDYYAESGDAIYAEGAVDVPLPQDIALGLHVGYQSIDDEATWGTPDYLDWKVGVSRPVAGVDVELAYVGTDLSRSECFGGSDLCDGRFVVTIAKSM